VTTPKSTDNDGQPAENQPRRYQTVRIHLHRCPVESPIPPLPIATTQKQGADHSAYGILQIRDQLNRQQRKGFLPLSAQKPGNGNPLLFKLRKQLDSIPKVGGNRSVAISIAADRTLWTNNGEKIDMAGQKRFFIFENRFKSVIVR